MSSDDCNFPFPSDRLPPCWTQEERMRFICAPFRNRSANPEEWIHKYQFWHELINSWSSYYALCCFNLSVLNSSFKRDSQKIACIPTVCEELYRNGELVLLSDFLKEPSSTWTGWMVDTFVKKSSTWVFSKVKSYISEPKFDMTEKYVYIATVKELAKLILSTVEGKKENTLLSLSKLTKNCIEKSKNDRITEESIKLAVIWLKRTKKATYKGCMNDNADDVLVKIFSNNAEGVTDIEEGIYKLTQQENMLIKNIENLEKERNEVIMKSKLSLSNGCKQVAKTFLRKKHELDKSIEKRSMALYNVQKLLSNIDDAHYDINTLAAYKAGRNALKKFEDSGLTEDKVKDAVDDLAEVLEELKEIKSVMNESIIINETDSELEQELLELMEAPEQNISDSEKRKSLPSDNTILPNLADLNLQDLPPLKDKASSKTTKLSQI